MGDLTRQPETKLLTQAMVQLRLVVDCYSWTACPGWLGEDFVLS